MVSIRHFIYQLLNQKKISWLVIAIATISKSILVAFFSNYETDKSYYLLLAKNLAGGKGFTIPYTFLSNPGITENIYLPSATSPLYSLLAAPLLKLFPDNYFLVSWLVESFSWLLLFIVLRKLLLLLSVNYFWTNIFILFSGFFLYNVELSSSPKDVMAIALLFLALFRCIRMGITGNNPSFSYLVITSILFILPGLMKFTYLPISIVFPLSLLLIGLLNKERRLIRSGFITLLLSILLVAGHYFYFLALDNQTTILLPDFYSQRWSMAKSDNDFVPGFFPENLSMMYPFIPASVINLDLLGVQIRSQLSSFYPVYKTLLHTINFIVLAVFCFLFFYLLKKYFRKPIATPIFFLLTGMCIALSIITLLSVMSVRYHTIEYKGSNASWTFVYENRPFLFPIIFLQVCFFVFLFSKKQKTIFSRWLQTFLLIILSVSFLHGAYFLSKKVISFSSSNQKKNSVNRLVTAIADSSKKVNPDYTVWLATETPHLDWYAKLNNQQVMTGLVTLNDSSFRLPPKTLLLTAIAYEDTAAISPYLRKPGVSLFRNYDNVFLVYLEKTPQ